MSVTFSGLSSGIDSAALIDQIVAAEKRPADLLTKRVSDLNSQGSIVDSLVSKLRAFGDRARGLDLASEIRSVKAERSDTSHVGVAVSGTASTSSHTLRVNSLARAQTTMSRSYASDSAGVLGTGSVSIDTPSGDPVSVSWTAADSLSAVAARINDAGSATTASVINDGTSFRLVLNARKTGTAGAPTFNETGAGLGLNAPGATTVPAKDASFTLDGLPITRSTNTVDDVLAGVTLTLTTAHAAADSDTTIDITADGGAMRDKVKGLVDAYNSVAAQLEGQLRYNGTTKGNDTLFGDSTMRSLQGALAKLVTGEYGSDNKTLAGLGIKLGSGGLLTLDTTKFDAALSKNPSAVEALFVDSGFANQVASLTDTYTRSGDGILSVKAKSIDDRTASYQKNIERIETAATKTGERMQAQFTALEKAMSVMKAQQSQMMQILGLS